MYISLIKTQLGGLMYTSPTIEKGKNLEQSNEMARGFWEAAQ